MNSAVEITNLLFRYGEYMDDGDFAAAAELLSGAEVKLADGRSINGSAMRDLWEKMIILHDGKPCTKHVITNPILDIDEGRAEATCRSIYTVIQSVDGQPPKIIAAGRYHDRFTREETAWRFTYRDYSLFDMQGDLSQHLRM